jgi:hypothetical protein
LTQVFFCCFFLFRPSTLICLVIEFNGFIQLIFYGVNMVSQSNHIFSVLTRMVQVEFILLFFVVSVFLLYLSLLYFFYSYY